MENIKLYEEYFWQDKLTKIRKFVRKMQLNADIVEDPKYGYIINSHHTNISHKILRRIPYKFGDESNDFDCSYNYLTNLKNSPISVAGNFNCSHNFISRIIECPSIVGKIDISFNRLERLDTFPEVCKRYCDISNNNLKTLDNLSVFIPLNGLKIFPNKYLSQEEVDKYMERRLVENQEGSPYKEIKKWVSKEFHKRKGDYYEKLEDFEIFFDEDEK